MMKHAMRWMCTLIFWAGMLIPGYAQTTSLVEGFEGVTTNLPDGWMAHEVPDSKPFKVAKFGGFGTNSSYNGDYYLFSTTASAAGWSAPDVMRDNWLILPQLSYTDGAVFSFYGRSKYAPTGDVPANEDERSSFEVRLSITNTETSDFGTTLLSVEKASDVYSLYSVDLSSAGLETGDLFYIAIRIHDDVVMAESFTRVFYIDDVSYGAVTVDQPIAELNYSTWTPEIEVGESVTCNPAFSISNQGDGTLTVSQSTDLSESAFTTTFAPAEVSLNTGESYSFTFNYAPQSAGNHSADFVITTTHGEELTIELSGTAIDNGQGALGAINEGFENGFPGDWRVVDGNANGSSWNTTTSSLYVLNGARTAILEQGEAAQDDWLMTPKVLIESDDLLKLTVQSTMAGKLDRISVKASKTGQSMSDFNIDIALDVEVPDEATELTYDLCNVEDIDAGDEIWLAIQCTSDGVGGLFKGNLLLDDVMVGVDATLSNLKEITSCEVENSVSVEIDANIASVNVIMPKGSDLTAIEPQFTLSDGATISPDVAQDFSAGAVVYTVTAENGTTKFWTVLINHELASACEILSCTVQGQERVDVDAENALVHILMPTGANLSVLEPQFTVSPGATINPTGVQDFTASSVIYTVTAEDGGSTKEWIVDARCEATAVEGIDESFEGESLPENWTVIDADGNGMDWFLVDYMPYDGEQIIKTKRNTNQNNDWLISPKVRVRDQDQLNFMYRSASINFPETFVVKVSKTGLETTDFSVLIDTIKDASAETAFTAFNYDLASHANIEVGDEIYIAIQCISKDRMELHIDKFTIAPPPVSPQAELRGNHWRAVTQISTAVNSEQRFALKNALVGTLEISAIEMPDGYDTDLQIDEVQLAAGEEIGFGVTFNPTTAGDYVGNMIIHTNGGDVAINLNGYAYAEHLYHEGFENEDSYRNWINLDADADGYTWFPYMNYEYAPDLAHSGEYCVVSESAELSGNILSPENWLITPKLIVEDNDKLVFWVGAVSDISFREHFSVKLSTTGTNMEQFTHVLIDDRELTTHSWQKVEVDLSQYTGEKVFIAFIHTGVTNESQIIMDDMILPALYQATTPDLQLALMPLEYTQMPLSQARFDFTAQVLNMGANLISDVDVKFSIEQDSYENIVTIDAPLNTEEQVRVSATTPFVPLVSGSYTMQAEAMLQNDDYQVDNTASVDFSVDTVYARDKGVYDNFIGIQVGLTGAVGQVFDIHAADKLTSVSYYQVASVAETRLSATIYAMNNQTPGQALATSPEVVVDAEFEGWVTIMLNEPLILTEGRYLVALNERAEDRLKVGVDQQLFTPETVYIYYNEEWLLAEETQNQIKIALLLRANFNAQENGANNLEADTFCLYPNPASDYIDMKGIAECEVRIYNAQGILQKAIFGNKDHMRLNVSDFVPGVYFISVNSGKSIVNKRFVVE